MKKLVKYLMVLSFLLCLCSHLYCVLIYGHQPASISKNVQKGVPYVFQSDEDYFGEIQRLRVTDDYVYVVFGGNALVKVYRHDGTYVGTIAVNDDHGSGGTWMNTDHTRAYIEHGGCLYEFDGIEFIHCYTTENDDLREKRESIELITIPANDYSFRFGNVIKYEHTPQEFVFIQRDFLHRIAYPGILLPAEVGIVLFWALIPELWYRISKKRSKSRNAKSVSSR